MEELYMMMSDLEVGTNLDDNCLRSVINLAIALTVKKDTDSQEVAELFTDLIITSGSSAVHLKSGDVFLLEYDKLHIPNLLKQASKAISYKRVNDSFKVEDLVAVVEAHNENLDWERKLEQALAKSDLV